MCGAPSELAARFCIPCGAAIGSPVSLPIAELPKAGEDLLIEAMKVCLAENSGIPAMPLLQRALALGLAPKDEVEARLSLGEAYREIFGNSGLTWQEMVKANEFHQCTMEIEKAFALDRAGSLGFFLEPLNIGRLRQLDLMYTLAAQAEQEQGGTDSAIAYLAGKLKAVDYLQRPPLLACLVRLGDLYRQRGSLEDAARCLTKVLGTAPLYPADDERNGELRGKAQQLLGEIQTEFQPSAVATSAPNPRSSSLSCAQHTRAPAVAQCNSCQRGLCNECADAYEPPTCSSCAAGAFASERSDAIKQLLITGGLFLLGMWMGYGLGSDPRWAPPYPRFFTSLLTGYVVASVPSGWRALSRITSRMFLFLPLAGWVFYFACKLGASATIGPFILPFKLWPLLRRAGIKREFAFGIFALVAAALVAAWYLLPNEVPTPRRIGTPQSTVASEINGNPNFPSPSSLLPTPSGAMIVDELNGSSVGVAHGVQWTRALGDHGASFTAAGSSRIEYPNDFPKEGTVELWLKVDSGYRYENGTFKPNEDDAIVFSTDVAGGDVTWPGAAKLVVSRNGDISFWMATKKGAEVPGRTQARATKFRFGEWHAVGISYGSQGQSIMLDGILVATDVYKTQSLGSAGNEASPLDVPTVGETVSHVWPIHMWEGGFEGTLARFRASPRQKDWILSLEVPPDSPRNTEMPPQISQGQFQNIEGDWVFHKGGEASEFEAVTVTIYGQNGPSFSVRGSGWSGTGSLNGDNGFYDWVSSSNGVPGRTTFKVMSDGTLQGQVEGVPNNPKSTWSFVAKRTGTVNQGTSLGQSRDSTNSGLGMGSIGGVYRAGENGVGNIECVYCPHPDYSDEARKARLAGEVLLEFTVLPDGKATNIRVIRSLGMGLDEKAIEAVRKWQFKPATGPSGKPVAAITQIQVMFQLF
jgi:TonB family protein